MDIGKMSVEEMTRLMNEALEKKTEKPTLEEEIDEDAKAGYFDYYEDAED